jgi:hypothetical protein
MSFAAPQEITCPICNQPIDLTKDRFANEGGKAVHENCYIQRVLLPRNDPPKPDLAG